MKIHINKIYAQKIIKEQWGNIPEEIKEKLKDLSQYEIYITDEETQKEENKTQITKIEYNEKTNEININYKKGGTK